MRAFPPSPPAPLSSAELSSVEAVFADVDGTLTVDGRLASSTLVALEQLKDAGIPVVLVSGRPAGWGDCWLRTLPVAGVVVENGGLYFARDRAGATTRVYAQAEADVRQRNRKRLLREVAKAIAQVRGARLSTDSAYTEVDLAIDYNEEVHLGTAAAERLEQCLRARQVQAVRSSVHVNCWIGTFDKLSTVKRFLRRQWKTALAPSDSRFCFVGDSFNDAPMFGAFPLSVGVANVLPLLPQLDRWPAFTTVKSEGKGFEELAQLLLKQRPKQRRSTWA